MVENKALAAFYDEFTTTYLKSGINDRVYGLYNRLKKLGLKSSSNVLELGCGIGTLTFLLSKIVKKGHIEAIDISPRSIAFCKQKINKAHIDFFVDDIVNYTPGIKKINLITLFDIIEHIPMEQHSRLFGNLSNIANDDTLIAINIPNPAYLQYVIENNPAVLQLIDQPLPLHFITNMAAANNLEIIFFETYSVWVEDDYQFFVIRKKTNFKEIKLSDKRNFTEKVAKKIQRVFIKLRHRYQ
jgi:trans-aconitate 2-methyltransferase